MPLSPLRSRMPHEMPLPRTPYLRHVLLQTAAFCVATGACIAYGLMQPNASISWTAAALLTGPLAFLCATVTWQAWWWRGIHALFSPAIALLLQLPIAPVWFLVAFVLLLLVYRGAASGQIPLFFSNQTTVDSVIDIVAHLPAKRFIDIGAGIGSLACPLAARLRRVDITAVENSPLPWVLGALRGRALPNCHWRFGSFWQIRLDEFDVAYAFLSPTPMPALWKKAKSEMRRGTLLISNSFPVPGIDAEAVIELKDERRTNLYCYRL